MDNLHKLSPKWRRFLGLLCGFLLCCGMASAQSITVTGTVVDETGFGLPGVNVLVDGTTSGTVTDIDGNFTLNTTRDATLIISFTGYETVRIPVDGTDPISIALEPSSALLDEVVVTGYQTQRKQDITGAVSVIESEELTAVAASSLNQQLEGRATGVTVSTSGQPGAGSAVRIRGYSTFGNSQPLLVVDGVPQINAFLNQINPNDVESIQILKDAAAASIYGTRASNGVIIVTTKNGKKNTRNSVTYDGYYGVQTPTRGWDDILIQDPQDYAQIIFDQFTNVGAQPSGTIYGGEDTGTPILPDYIFPAGFEGDVDESTYSYPDNLIMRANQEGTNWWDEVFDPAPIQDHTVAISGGSENGSFRISGNYFDQQGTMIDTYFRRFSLRANSQWTVGKLTIGENLNLGRVEQVGVPGGNQQEGGTIISIVKAQPIIPVYDIAGNFAGGKSPGLGNGPNPVKQQFMNKDDVGQFDQIQGSAYAAFEVIPGLTAKTQFGFNVGTSFSQNFNDITPEESEPNFTNSYSQDFGRSTDWVWTNTLSFNRTFDEVHDLSLLAGTEAIRETSRSINGSFANYFVTELSVRYLQGGLADPDTRQVGSFGQTTTLSSLFGQLNYAYDNKYLISATVRRDGSSRFGNDKYGVFPAASLGWRISSEPFLANSSVINDLKIRAGYGVLGNQDIDPYNFFDFYGGGTGNTFFDIRGTNNSLVTGYTATRRGNPLTTWEEKQTVNAGFDLSLLNDKFYMVLDLYSTEVDGLLVRALDPRTSGLATPPFINVGNMENRGVDLQLGWRPRLGEVTFDIGLNASHYRNEITQIDGVRTEFFSGTGTRIGNLQINRLGNPIGAFFGFQADGIFQNQSEVDAHADQGGKAVGRLRFADVDGFDDDGVRTGQPDGVINDADRVIIGNPHPDLTAGLNIAVNYRNWDFTAFFFGSFGNDAFNYVKLFTDFRQFNTNANTALLTDSWTPSNPDASIPQLDFEDLFSRQVSSYYVEDGSYIRAKQLQLGYTLPQGVGGDIFQRLRFYVQAQNLFTITNYSGLDPAFSSFEQGDLDLGVDYGNFPVSRIIMFGVNAGF